MNIYFTYLPYILLISNNFILSLSFNLPPVFREWHCINFVKNIDITKPYPFKIGDLPLISWHDNIYNKTYTTVNICSHMGSKLDNSKINNGCLVCPYHGMLYSEEKAFGETLIYQDKLWWSYEPIANKPPSTPFYNNKNYTTTNICIDIDANIMDCALNIMDVNLPQYYNMLMPPKKIKKYKYFNTVDNTKKLSLGISFKNNMMELNEYNKYFNMYKFPYNAWTRILFPDKKQAFMNIDFLPIGIDKTRWFITIKNNRMSNNIFTKPFMYYYVNQYKELLGNNQALHTNLKKLVIRQEVLANENHLDDIYDMFEKYNYPDNNMVCNLYKYHKREINNKC